MTPSGLSRQLGLAVLIFYGIGDILGAGIYALVGKVAGTAGPGAWISFALSGLLALATGLSYAELSSRIPHSAGAAAFCLRAFRHPFVPFLIGALVLASGITSAATVSLAVHGYLQLFLTVPPIIAALGLIVIMNGFSFWGIRHSAAANNVLTLIELGGLLLVITVGLSFAFAQHSPAELAAALAPAAGETAAIFAGMTLAFYAFVGFEDLANLADEAKQPARDLPRAILFSTAITTVIYLLVICTVLWTLTPQAAAASERPLLDVLERAGLTIGSKEFAAVALVAVCNTGLANTIMASRLLYGMAREQLLPAVLTRVHPRRQTPWAAVLCTTLLCALLVLSGGVAVLAKTTSLLLTLIFLFVHASLIRIRRGEPHVENVFRAPRWNPYLGILGCALLLTQFPADAYTRLGIIAAVVVLLYCILQLKSNSFS